MTTKKGANRTACSSRWRSAVSANHSHAPITIAVSPKTEDTMKCMATGQNLADTIAVEKMLCTPALGTS